MSYVATRKTRENCARSLDAKRRKREKREDGKDGRGEEREDSGKREKREAVGRQLRG